MDACVSAGSPCTSTVLYCLCFNDASCVVLASGKIPPCMPFHRLHSIRLNICPVFFIPPSLKFWLPRLSRGDSLPRPKCKRRNNQGCRRLGRTSIQMQRQDYQGQYVPGPRRQEAARCQGGIGPIDRVRPDDCCEHEGSRSPVESVG